MELSDAFLTMPLEHPDFAGSDVEAECQRLFRRQQAIAGMLEGRIDPDTVLDMLAEDSIEPTAYTDSVWENLEFLQIQGV